MQKETAITKLYVSPSGWQTWTKCALSLQNRRTSFRTDSDDYADEGTKIHAAIAAFLRLGIKSNENGLNPADLDEDYSLVRFAVGVAEAEADGYAMLIEHEMSLVKNGVTIAGTADCLIPIDDTIVVIDWKTGWKEVEAEENKQLKLYAHMYAHKHKVIKRWRGIIVNARFNSISFTGGNIESKYLASVVNDLKKRTEDGQNATGNHCAYCPRLTICKKLQGEINKWLQPGTIDSLTREPERLAEALRLAKPAEKLFETVKKEAQLFIDLGGVIPGVSIEYSSGTRAWPKDMTTREIALRIGLTGEDMIDTKTISPAEAERRGASNTSVNEIVIRPPRKGFKFS
jgi:hypothetical protein